MGSEQKQPALAAVASALDHPIRLGIVEELAGQSGDEPAGFSALRDAVGLRDNGRFNYHLDELRGDLVEHVDSGYRLTTTGEALAQLRRTGHLAAPDRRRTLPAGTPCHGCSSSLALSIEPRLVHLRCDSCSWDRQWAVPVPRKVFEAEPPAARTAVDRVLGNAAQALADGLCPTCLSQAEARLTASTESDVALAVDAAQDCHHCGATFATTVGHLALTHEAAATFLADHGVSLANRRTWDLAFAVTDHQTRVRSRDPWRLEVRPQLGNDELVLTVDETATVTATRRHTKFTARDVWYPNRVQS